MLVQGVRRDSDDRAQVPTESVVNRQRLLMRNRRGSGQGGHLRRCTFLAALGPGADRRHLEGWQSSGWRFPRRLYCEDLAPGRD